MQGLPVGNKAAPEGTYGGGVGVLLLFSGFAPWRSQGSVSRVITLVMPRWLWHTWDLICGPSVVAAEAGPLSCRGGAVGRRWPLLSGFLLLLFSGYSRNDSFLLAAFKICSQLVRSSFPL